MSDELQDVEHAADSASKTVKMLIAVSAGCVLGTVMSRQRDRQ